MPPRLDLSKTFAHGDMIMSPGLQLRRAGSYNPSEKGPLSATSSRFGFNHLGSSPPPSPGLPLLASSIRKPIPPRTSNKRLKVVLWTVGVVVILCYGFSAITAHRSVRQVGWANNAGDEYEMVGDSELPDFPTPVVVTDKRGRAKWTVSIPPDHSFPLQPAEYAEICQQNMEVANHVGDLHRHLHIQHAAHYDYYYVDPNFMDVGDAEEHGLLPGLKAKTSMKVEDGSIVGVNNEELIESEVCQKTMTFLLETSDAGLGETLMMMWTAYGLAKKEGREFFIDDSRWAYGKYTSFFRPPPTPRCRPPPRHQMLPCPHHASHLIVSAATAAHTFGGAFNDAFEDARKMEVYRQLPIFTLARVGYEALFHLSASDQLYVDERISQLNNQTFVPPHDVQGTITAVHVRKGDKHPYEFQFRDSYIPLDRYMSKAKELLHASLNASGVDPSAPSFATAEAKSLTIVASDDPEVYTSEEFRGPNIQRAQELILLASGSSNPTPNPADPIRKFRDENVGWEGGFFAGMFWSLGKANAAPATAMESPADKAMMPPSEETLRLRELVGRAYLVDLAVLGQGGDRVICTVSSMGCKLLAVMMGWQKAIVEGKWVNIDGDFEWTGVRW